MFISIGAFWYILDKNLLLYQNWSITLMIMDVLDVCRCSLTTWMYIDLSIYSSKFLLPMYSDELRFLFTNMSCKKNPFWLQETPLITALCWLITYLCHFNLYMYFVKSIPLKTNKEVPNCFKNSYAKHLIWVYRLTSDGCLYNSVTIV